MFRILTTVAFFFSVGLDYITSQILLVMGFAETNPLYQLLGSWFWILYLIANTAAFIACVVVSKKQLWALHVLWLPAIAHLVCGFHNLSLLI